MANKEIITNEPLSIKKRNDVFLTWICVAAIALITYFVFSPSLDDGFTNWDDNYYVTGNPLVQSNTIPIVKIFETPVASNYHPLTVLSLALNYQTGKLNPFGYHLENVILHVLNTILVFFFIFLLTRRNLLMAAIAALFFGIHPMHVESVTWISERKDVLYVFFFIAGLITYLLYRETRKIGWYIFTLLLFILSCLSKGMAVVFPVILLLIDYLRGIKWSRKIIIEKIPFFLIALVFGIIAFEVQQSEQAITAMSAFTVFQRLIFMTYGAMMYIVRFFAPYKLSAFYRYPITNSSQSLPLIFYLSMIIVLVLLAAVVYFFLKKKKKKEMVFGLLFYFISIVLVLQFVSVGRVIMADRYTYLSYIGLLFIAAYLVNRIWQNKSGVWKLMKYPFVIIVAIGAVVFSFQTYGRTQVWKNSGTLWTDVINNYPDAYMAYYDRACYDIDNSDAADAIPDLNKDLELSPYDKDAYFGLGTLYAKYYNKYDLAITDFTRAIIIDPTFKNAYFNRALLYSDGGKYDSALADYNAAIKLDPDFLSAYNYRGILYYKLGKADLAISDFTKTVELNPDYADGYNNRGSLYLSFGKPDLAIVDINKAIELDPASATYYYDRGLYYKAIQQYGKAIDDFTKGIDLKPANADFYYDMRGICNDSIKRYNEAIADFSAAIEQSPANAYYLLDRSSAESKLGQNEMAKADELRAQQLQAK